MEGGWGTMKRRLIAAIARGLGLSDRSDDPGRCCGGLHEPHTNMTFDCEGTGHP